MCWPIPSPSAIVTEYRSVTRRHSTTFVLFLLFAVAPYSNTASAQQSGLRDAFRMCITQTLSNMDDLFIENGMSFSSSVKIEFLCKGVPAKQLYDAVQDFAVQNGPNVDDRNQTRITRFFGQDPRPGVGSSQCISVIEDSQKRAINRFQCNITLDLGSSVIAAW